MEAEEFAECQQRRRLETEHQENKIQQLSGLHVVGKGLRTSIDSHLLKGLECGDISNLFGVKKLEGCPSCSFKIFFWGFGSDSVGLQEVQREMLGLCEELGSANHLAEMAVEAKSCDGLNDSSWERMEGCIHRNLTKSYYVTTLDSTPY